LVVRRAAQRRRALPEDDQHDDHHEPDDEPAEQQHASERRKEAVDLHGVAVGSKRATSDIPLSISSSQRYPMPPLTRSKYWCSRAGVRHTLGGSRPRVNASPNQYSDSCAGVLPSTVEEKAARIGWSAGRSNTVIGRPLPHTVTSRRKMRFKRAV